MDTTVTTAIDQEKCIGCGLCVQTCPARTLSMNDKKAVVSGDRCIACGHCLAVCPSDAVSVAVLGQGSGAGQVHMHGFSFERSCLKPGDYDEVGLARLMASRRSCRIFDEHQPLSREILEDLVSFARMAPSASNNQMWTFTLLPDRLSVVRLVDEVAAAFDAINAMATNPLARLAMKLLGKKDLENWRANYMESMVNRLNQWRDDGWDRFFYHAPAAMVIACKNEANMPVADCNLAAQNVMLAAHAMGLGSCYIGYAVNALGRRAEARRAIGLPEGETAHVVLALGKCKEKFQRQAGRLPTEVRWA